jgi:hypothetical protein
MGHRVFHIELPIRSEWTAVEDLRGSVLACLRAVFEDDDRAEPLAMVAGELLENAVKYGRWDLHPDEPFALRVDGSDDEVEIAVTNPVDAPDPGVARLLELLRRLREAPSAREVYLERLRIVADEDGASGGLGLARIAYETGCTLEAEVLPAGVVRVRAVTPRAGAPAGAPALHG